MPAAGSLATTAPPCKEQLGLPYAPAAAHCHEAHFASRWQSLQHLCGDATSTPPSWWSRWRLQEEASTWYEMSFSIMPHQKWFQSSLGDPRPDRVLMAKMGSTFMRRLPTRGGPPSWMTAEMASWWLPPLPRFSVRTTCDLPTLLKMLSTPPKETPLWTWVRRCQRPWMVSEAAFALKSPTRSRLSPSWPWAAMRPSRLVAVCRPPQVPPEFTESGPWWFTKTTVLPVSPWRSRSHMAPRRP
mmetsp:Transcript_51786/g.113016  ORF Transcript_51786/g.113016 Transcript_51786/m.113016 type:complete len:242 (+) Transcript_51786:228-953(+)